MYKWILLIHGIGGAVLFGGHVYIESIMANAAKATDRATSMEILTRVGQTASRIMGPAGIVTLVFGVWVVLDGSWKFEQLFVVIGFAVVVMGLAIGMFLMRPLEEEINAEIETNGLDSDGVVTKMAKMTNLVHTQTLLVTIAFGVMFLKPGV